METNDRLLEAEASRSNENGQEKIEITPLKNKSSKKSESKRVQFNESNKQQLPFISSEKSWKQYYKSWGQL